MKKGIAVTSAIFVLVTGITAMFGMSFALGVVDNFVSMESGLDQHEQLSGLHRETDRACQTVVDLGASYDSTTDEYELPGLQSLSVTSGGELRGEFEDSESAWISDPITDCNVEMNELTEEGAYEFRIIGENGENPSIDVEVQE